MKVQFNLSVMKPLHGDWLVQTYNRVREKAKLLRDAFVKAGFNDGNDNVDNDDDADTVIYLTDDEDEDVYAAPHDTSISCNESDSFVMVIRKSKSQPDTCSSPCHCFVML